VTELESAPPTPPAPNDEDQAEIARLRGELANHMERAQAAEERAASLEADVLAARRGVSALPIEAPVDGPSETASDESPDDDRLAGRFEMSHPDVETHEPDHVAAQKPEVQEPEVHEAEVREPEAQEAEVREPEVQEPEVREPEVREPEVQEAGVREPEVQEVEREAVHPEGWEAAGSIAEAAPEPQREEPTHEPVNRWGSFAATEADDVDVASETSSQEPSAPEAVDTPVSSGEPSLPERDENEAPADTPAEPIATEMSEPEPVEDAPVHEPAPTASAVEWHAPAATPETAPASPNGNGIPPAPSDEARYDDIWTAAFAPPEPQPEPALAESRPPSEEATPETHVSNETTPEPHVSNETTPEPHVSNETTPQPEAREESSTSDGSGPSEADVSPDDQPSPPQDELSAEDDMWSLRARLADAAARKHTLPRQTTES
jgi:hypothetical protein